MNLLSGIEAFVQVAESGSFVAAARNLSLSPSAVSKLISKTEEAVGVRLVHRSTRSTNLTAEGVMFLERCKTIIGELEQAKQDLSSLSSTPRGKLKVGFPNLATFLIPVIGRFLDAHPEISLEFDFTDRVADVVDEGFDVVLRSGELVDSRLMSRFVGRYVLGLYATPQYLEARGTPKCVADLQRHNCIQYRFPSTGRTEAWPNPEAEGRDVSPPGSLICNSVEARLHLALQGRGIAFLPDTILRGYIEAGELVEVLPTQIRQEGTFHLLWPATKYASPKVRSFVDFMGRNLFPIDRR